MAMEGLVQPPNLAGMVLSPFVIGAHVIERDVLPPVHQAVEAVHHAGSVAVDFARRIVTTI